MYFIKNVAQGGIEEIAYSLLTACRGNFLKKYKGFIKKSELKVSVWYFKNY
jgi:hypothetical protein